MLRQMLDSLIVGNEFLDGAVPVIPYGAAVEPESSSSQILVISGDNGTGKTVLLSHFANFIAKEGKVSPNETIAIVNIGMKMRTGADGSSGTMRSMMFGSESHRSTGTISLRIIEGSFHNAAEWPVRSVVMLDEPEIGVSETYYSAIAELISLRANSLRSDKVPFVVIVTHSHDIARGLIERGASGLHLPGEGDALSPEDWLAGNFPQYSLEHLLNMPDRSRNVGSRITRAVNKRKEEQRKL